jgi:hypothetical protein
MPIQQSSRITNILEAAGNSSLRSSSDVPTGEKYKGENIKTKQQASAILAEHVRLAKSKGEEGKGKEVKEPSISLKEALAFLHDPQNINFAETDLKNVVEIITKESIEQADRSKAVEILRASFADKNKKVGNVANSDLALDRLLTMVGLEIEGKGDEARDSAIGIASLIESDSYNNPFFAGISKQGSSALGMIGNFVRAKTKYFDYVNELPKELIKSIEPGDNSRLSSLSEADKEFREYLAERLLNQHFQIKEDGIRVSRDLTLEPIRVRASELQEMRGEKNGKYSDKVLTLRGVLKKMAAAKNSKERAAAVASYYEMNNILEYRFGKEVENMKAADEQIAAGKTTTMPSPPAPQGSNMTPDAFKRRSETRAKDWAGQLEALHLAVKSPAIMGDFKELFEQSIKQYSVMLLASDLPKSINTLTQPELNATFRKEVNKLRNEKNCPTTAADDVQLKQEADSLTENYKANKEDLSGQLMKAFFGKDTLSTEDIFQAKTFAKIAKPGLDASDRQASLDNLKAEIVENFISEKVIADDQGNIDLTEVGMQKLFEKYIDPSLVGTTQTINHPQETIDHLRDVLNDQQVFANLVNNWSAEEITYTPNRSQATGQITQQTTLNELENIRPAVLEYSFNHDFVNNPNNLNQRVEEMVSTAVKKGALLDTVVNASKFTAILEHLRDAGYGSGHIKNWTDSLNSYASNKNKAASAITSMYNALQNSQNQNLASLSTIGAFGMLTEALDLKETSIVGDEASFKEDLGNSIADLYNKIASEDVSASNDKGGLNLLQNIIRRDEDSAKRQAPNQKLLMQGERGYYEFVMTKDAGFVSADGTGFDSELRLISLGRLIQEVQNSNATNTAKQDAIEYIIGALQENSSNDFTTRVAVTMLAEADKILGNPAQGFAQFHELQRREANFGLARAKVEAKKGEIAAEMLKRVISRSVKKETGILGQFKSILEKVVGLISGGESHDLGEKLAKETDPDLGVFKKAYDIATGNRSNDYGYKSYLKDSKEVDPEHRDAFFKALTQLDRKMAEEEYPSSSNSSSSSSSTTKPTETEKDPVTA